MHKNQNLITFTLFTVKKIKSKTSTSYNELVSFSYFNALITFQHCPKRHIYLLTAWHSKKPLKLHFNIMKLEVSYSIFASQVVRSTVGKNNQQQETNLDNL